MDHTPRQLARILAQAKTPLRDAAAVNATHWAPWHALDALCVGELVTVTRTPAHVLAVTATGRGPYARTRTDKYGFPRQCLPRQKQFFGYRTGDFARAVVLKGKKAGTHIGRVAVRATGSFDIKTTQGLVQGIGHMHFRLLQRADGYAYTTRPEGPTGTT